MKTRILLVEDDERLAKLTAEYLSKNDFEVSVEIRGDAAESRILEENPELVILDVMLPGKDGFEVCRSVRAQYKGVIIMPVSYTHLRTPQPAPARNQHATECKEGQQKVKQTLENAQVAGLQSGPFTEGKTSRHKTDRCERQQAKNTAGGKAHCSFGQASE